MKQYHDWLIYAFARTNHFKWFIDGYAGMQYRQHALNDLWSTCWFFRLFGQVKRVIKGEGFDQVCV